MGEGGGAHRDRASCTRTYAMVGSELDVDCEFLILELRIFFQLAKQDICTIGFCIQLSIYINIEPLSETEKEVQSGVSGETDSFLVRVLFFTMFYSNHQLGQKRILSFSSVIKAFLAELFSDVSELSDLDSLQCLPLAPKSYACIICAFLCINEIFQF